MTYMEALRAIPDPRARNSTHDLTEILFSALMAKMCGARNFTEIAIFVAEHIDELRKFIPFKNGAPSHDTYSAAFRMIDPKAFDTAFRLFMSEFGKQARLTAGRQFAVDGKCLRRAYDKGKAHMPPITVTVYDCDTLMGLTLAVGEKGGESKAATDALSLLSIKGVTITGDALNCHRRFTQVVREKGGHYAITLKGNQSKLHKEAEAALEKALDNPRTKYASTDDDAHGRSETRLAVVFPFVQSPGSKTLVGLKAIGAIASRRTVNGKTTLEVRLFALSKLWTPEKLLEIVRKHWLIENKLHWQIDTNMAEDDARTRKDNGPANLAILNRLALNVFRDDPRKIPIRHKQLYASWDINAFYTALAHMR